MIPSVLPTYSRAPLSFVKGEGSWLIEQDGRRFLDLGAGIAVNALGHAHPALVAALTEQAGQLWHTSNLYEIPQQQELADRLVALSFADTVFFTNSGTEAVMAALRVARAFTGKDDLLDVVLRAGIRRSAWPEHLVVLRPNEDGELIRRITINFRDLIEKGELKTE